MNSEPSELQKELQRRVGRNLLLFQSIERLMKFVLVNSTTTVTATGKSPADLKREESILKRSMGQLSEHFFAALLSDAGERDVAARPVTEARVTTSIRLEIGPGDSMRRYQDEFAEIIDQRNDLVHHFLSQWDLASPVSTSAAIEHLDRQREQALMVHAHLQSVADAIRTAWKETSEFLESEEGQRQFDLLWLQQSRLVAHLFAAAQLLARPDGWTLLSMAGDSLRREVPDQLAAMRTHYKHRTLKALVQATELFDLWDEPTSAGRFRTLIRIKPQPEGAATA